jgi:hypothetical protein
MSNFELIEKVRLLGNEFSKKQDEANRYFEQNRQRIGESEIHAAYWVLENAAIEAGFKYSKAGEELAQGKSIA